MSWGVGSRWSRADKIGEADAVMLRSHDWTNCNVYTPDHVHTELYCASSMIRIGSSGETGESFLRL